MIYVMSGSGGGGLNGVALIWCEFPTDATSVTCSNGTKTYTVPAKWLSSGGYCFAVNAVGTWTLTANKDAAHNAVKTVDVQAGKQYSVMLSFLLFLYDYGDTCPDVSGGWVNGTESGSVSFGEVSFTAIASSYHQNPFARPNNAIDLTNIKTLYFELKSSRTYPTAYPRVGVTSKADADSSEPSQWTVSKTLSSSSTFVTLNLDVSSLFGHYYIGAGLFQGDAGGGQIEVRKVWGEPK